MGCFLPVVVRECGTVWKQLAGGSLPILSYLDNQRFVRRSPRIAKICKRLPARPTRISTRQQWRVERDTG